MTIPQSVKNRIGLKIHRSFVKNETAIHELNYLFWECTLRCNLNCLHCGSDCTKDASHPDMPFDDFLRAVLPLIDKYGRDKITIVITGGEPLLRKDLAECGRKLRKNGFRWSIVTNGYFYDEEKHNELLNAGLGAITLSLDGLENSHNWLRGKSKSFENTVKALKLITATPRLNFDVVSCINQRNINELDEIRDFLIKNNVPAWRLFTIAPIGRAKDIDELSLTPDQFTRMMAFISTQRKSNSIKINFSCEGYVGHYEKKVRDNYFFCRAGINIGSILVDGSISACPNIDRSFIQGNIYKDKLLNIWENKFQIMRDRSWMKNGSCFDCKEFTNCKGNGFHLRDGKSKEVICCHHSKLQ